MYIEYNNTYNKLILPVLPVKLWPERWRGMGVSSMGEGLCEFFTYNGLEIAIPPDHDRLYDKWEYAYAVQSRYPAHDVLDINFMSSGDMLYCMLAYGDDAYALYSSFFAYEESVIEAALYSNR